MSQHGCNPITETRKHITDNSVGAGSSGDGHRRSGGSCGDALLLVLVVFWDGGGGRVR